MNITQIESNLQKLMKSFDKKTFVYELLLAYGLPKASITRLQKGNLNLSKIEGEICWKKKVLFKEEYNEDLHITVSELAKNTKHNERFVIVTDYKTLLAIDTKTDDKLDIELKDLPKHYDFFLPWAGMEKAQHKEENPADVKAAEKMARLFDEIKKDNPSKDPEFIHGLNVFLSRLLFCFFAEDTDIFDENQFTKAIISHTQTDGSDLNDFLDRLFDVLNTAEDKRKGLPAYLEDFKYVNGGLFQQKLETPIFTRRSRQAIIDSGEMDWSAINPDIFGSMIQAVITPEHRGGLGMHYTSVPNIMKVIEPLFLNDLYEVFEKAQGNPKKLSELLHRLSKIKIFDPACGSGNFLIIAYKELRRLEIKIIQHLQELQKAADGFKRKNEPIILFDIPKAQLDLAASFQVELFSRIQLNQFFGIELDDFAHEIAQLSLWLAEHQMNVEFKKEFGQTNPTLPLKEAGQITHGNACRIDWESVCPKKKEDEIYVLGNPPYLGYSLQSPDQKADMKEAFAGYSSYKNLDYISCWFIKGARFVFNNNNASFSFVSTNSINQGEQVPTLWGKILEMGVQISFAHLPFLWSNNAKSKAAVYCNIVGVTKAIVGSKRIYNSKFDKVVSNISPYLIEGENIFVQKRSSSLSLFPPMLRGSGATDDGNLLLSNRERMILIESFPDAEQFIKKYIGSYELINGIDRYCLWLDPLRGALDIPEINNRVQRIAKFRYQSKKASTREHASEPHLFTERRHYLSNSTLIVPRVSSERRTYFPIGFLTNEYVISDSASGIYNAPIWLISILSSLMHSVWIRAVAGRLKSDYRYSSQLCYNTFPFPKISEQRRAEITQCAFRILEEREKYPEKTLAQLYDPDKMPEGLLEAHRANDEVIEKCYRSRPFESDEERLEFLFKLYEKMIEEEKYKGSLFEVQKKTKKKKHA